MEITINGNCGPIIETVNGNVNFGSGYGETSAEHFPLHGSEAEGRELYVQLVAGGYISGSIESWLYLMGYVAVRPANVQPLEWKKNVQLAREMLCLALKEPLEKKVMGLKEMEQMASQCFVKDGSPMRLSKPRRELSADSDELERIFSDPKRSGL